MDDGRLDGWKAIGNHLGRDRTTAIRWARERGLPVHRVPGGRTGTVYALRGDLDAWRANGGGALPHAQPDLPPVAAAFVAREAPGTPRVWRRRGSAVALAVAAGGAAMGIWLWQRPASEAPPVGIAAVTSARDNEPSRRFARDLTADLARFANASAGLAVYDESRVFRRQVAYQVRTAVEGSAPRLVVRVWLTSTRDGAVVWSRRVEQSTPEPALLRERIAAYVVGIVRCGLGALEDEGSRLAPSEVGPLLATCQAIFDNDFGLAASHARSFVAAHPELAAGWATLAQIQAVQADSSGDRAMREQAKANAAKALVIAPNNLPAQLGLIYALDATAPESLRTIERALRTHPDNPDLLRAWSVMLFNLGYVRASVEPALRAMESDPTFLIGRDLAVRRLAAAGRYDEAWRLQGDNERLWPGHPALAEQRNMLLQETARSSTSSRAGEPAARPSGGGGNWTPGDPAEAYGMARAADRRGDRREALLQLNRAPIGWPAHQQWSLLFWPSAASLRTDPAFFRKMAALGLVRVWRARGQWPDFCADPGLDYDCAIEASRLGAQSGRGPAALTRRPT